MCWVQPEPPLVEGRTQMSSALSIPPNAPVASPCSHPVFENSSKIVIVMEYASKGDLYDYISERQRLSEQEARHFFRQVVSAVYYCHKVNGAPWAQLLWGHSWW